MAEVEDVVCCDRACGWDLRNGEGFVVGVGGVENL